MKGQATSYRGFSEVFKAWGSPTPRPGAGDAWRPLYEARRACFEGLVLRIFGVPLNYTTVSRVNSAFPFISSVSNITSAVMNQYATDVEAEIDTAISKRYALPLTVTCPILVAIATRETIYRIAVQRSLIQFPPAQQGRAPLQVQHEDDQKLLTKLAEGKLQLISNSGAVIASDLTQSDIYSTTMDYLPTFHEGDWGDMIQDPDKLDAIISDRDL